MSGADEAHPDLAADMRRRLHDASGHLSNAVLQLSLLLEDSTLEPSRRSDVESALESCRAAAERLREIWPLVPGS